MVKFISVIRHPEGADPAEVRAYWFDVHSRLVKAALPGLRKYVVNLPVGAPGGGSPPCDGVVELHFDDMESLQRALSSPGWTSVERKASSSKVIDYSRFLGVYAEERVIPLDGQPGAA